MSEHTLITEECVGAVAAGREPCVVAKAGYAGCPESQRPLLRHRVRRYDVNLARHPVGDGIAAADVSEPVSVRDVQLAHLGLVDLLRGRRTPHDDTTA